MQQILTADLSGGARILKVWNHQLGVQYYSQSSGEERWGFYWNSSLPVTKFAWLDFRVQRNVFAPVGVGLDWYQEWVARGGVSLRLN